MICKFCGTESNGTNCPKCGMPMTIRMQSRPQTPPSDPPAAPQYAPYQPPMQPQASQFAPPQQPPMQPQAPQFAPPQQPPMQPQTPQFAPPQQLPTEPQRPVQPQQPQVAREQYSRYMPYERRQGGTPFTQNPPAGRSGYSAAPQSVPTVRLPEAMPSYSRQNQLQVVSKQPSARKAESPLRLKNVFWAAIALLLPLAYLFFDLFAFLTPDCMKGTVLPTVFHSVGSGQNDAVSISALVELATGETDVLYEVTSAEEMFLDLTAGSGVEELHLLSAGVVVLFAAACAVLGCLLLFSGGRLLKGSIFNSLLSLFGTGAVFAPLLGMLTLNLYNMIKQGLGEAEVAMQGVAATPEALLIMLTLCCTLLPALGSLRRLSARADGKEAYPLFPCRSAARRSYGTLKVTTLCLLLAALAVPVLYLFLPVYGEGTLFEYLEGVFKLGGFEYFAALLEELWLCIQAFFGGNAVDINLYGFIGLVLEITVAVTVCVLAFALLHGLISLLRVAFMKEDAFTRGRSAERLCRSLRTRARNAALTPYVCLALCQVILTVMILCATPVSNHLDFNNVRETMNAYYLSVFYLKSTGGLSSVFTLITLGAAVLWHGLSQVSLALVARNVKKQKTF